MKEADKLAAQRHTLRGCVDWNYIVRLADYYTRKSHPSWVCGLKQKDLELNQIKLCHTLRGCVDWNWMTSLLRFEVTTSHPSWVCGLKLSLPAKTWRTLPVTPFVGVWIETYSEISPCFCLRVTPFVGVWIETILFVCIAIRVASHPSWVCGLKRPYHLTIADSVKSHPSWVCGLKHQKTYKIAKVRKVTPFVGVWIETTSTLWYTLIVKSHPSWVCGMKQKTDFIFWAHLKKSFLQKRAIDCQ